MNKEVLQSLSENGGPELNYVCGLILQNSDEDIDRFTDALFKIFDFAGIESQRVGGRKKRGGGIKELKAYIILCFLLVTVFSARTCTDGKGYLWNSPEYSECMTERLKEVRYENALAEGQRAYTLAELAAKTASFASSSASIAARVASNAVAADLDNADRMRSINARKHEDNMQMIKDYAQLLAYFLLAVASIKGLLSFSPRSDPKLDQLTTQVNQLTTALLQNGVITKNAPGPTAPVVSGALMPSSASALVPRPPAINRPTAADLASMQAAPLVGPLPGYNAVAGHNNLYNIPENNFYPGQMTHAAEAYNASLAHYRLYVPNPLQTVRSPIGYTQLQTLEELHTAFGNREPVNILWTTNPNYAGGKSRRRHKKRSTRKR